MTGPNTPSPGIKGPGGGKVGAVLISPCIAGGTITATPYNHYALLRSIEDIFGLGYLGYAGQAQLQGFGGDVFTRQPCAHSSEASVGPAPPASGPGAGPQKPGGSAVRISGLPRAGTCAAGGLALKIDAGAGARSVTARLEGRRVAFVRHRRFTLRLSRGALRAGANRLVVTVHGTGGMRRRSVLLRACGRTRIHRLQLR
jgi:hypothetical protein